jgi:ribonuclease VapC
MVIDSSALIAILQHEPERDAFFERIAESTTRKVSAVSLLETGLVMFGKLGRDGLTDLKEFLQFIEADVVAFDATQAHAALTAFGLYGKGVNSKTRLNMGDCASYALAKTMTLPLLYKGDDFKSTDIVSAG